MVGEPLAERRAQLSKSFGLEARPSNLEVVKGVDIVVLAVKPQNLADVMSEVGPALSGDQGSAVHSCRGADRHPSPGTGPSGPSSE